MNVKMWNFRQLKVTENKTADNKINNNKQPKKNARVLLETSFQTFLSRDWQNLSENTLFIIHVSTVSKVSTAL